VDYRLEGGYLTSPRWGKGFRKGKMRGVLAGIYTPEDLKKMSAAEVQKTIETDLFTDAYEEQKRKPIRFKSKVRAEYLETLLYQCPACKAFGSLHSEGAGLFCSCGYEAEFTEYGMVKDKAGRRTKLTTLVQKQQESLKKSLEETDLLLFQDEVNVSRINEEHMVEKEEKLTLSAYPDRLTLGEETLPLSKISDMAIVQRNKLIIHVSGERVHLEISGDERLNAVKYRDLYRISNE